MNHDNIRVFFEKYGIPKPILESKIAAFSRHEDIASEFEEWIHTKSFKSEGAICVEGYTAKKLAALSDYLNGDGAFMLLIELRENPDRALSKIKKGFKYK